MARHLSHGDLDGILMGVTSAAYAFSVALVILPLFEATRYLMDASIPKVVMAAACLLPVPLVGFLIVPRLMRPILEESAGCEPFWGRKEYIIIWGTLAVMAISVSVAVFGQVLMNWD
jgi:hypothetical protein